MFTDKQLLEIQKFAKPYEESFKNGEVAEDIKLLMKLSDGLEMMNLCPRCGCFSATYFGEGGEIPDGRVTCIHCHLSTKYHKHTSKKFDFRFNKYRDIREALEDWNSEKLYDYGVPGGHWERDSMSFLDDVFSDIGGK